MSLLVGTTNARSRNGGNTILFQAAGLQKSFGGVQAVRDLSLKIPARRSLCRHRAEWRRKIDTPQPDERPLST